MNEITKELVEEEREAIFLNKEGLLNKLSYFGYSTWPSILKLIRLEGLPSKGSRNKPYFLESEIDFWLKNRTRVVAKNNTTRIKRNKEARRKNKAIREELAKKALRPFKAERGQTQAGPATPFSPPAQATPGEAVAKK
jgi:hypothetical protein